MWNNILIPIISTVLTSGILTYFIQRYIDGDFNKKLAEYNDSLNRTLEIHKAKLGIALNKQSKLHEKRLEIVSEIFSLLTDMNFAMLDFTAEYRTVIYDAKKEAEERLIKAANSYDKVYIHFTKNRIYFDQKMCDQIEAFLEGNVKSFADYIAHGSYKFKSDSDYKQLQSISKRVTGEFQILLKQIEQNFRSIIDENILD